jgi:hypothetical protein
LYAGGARIVNQAANGRRDCGVVETCRCNRAPLRVLNKYAYTESVRERSGQRLRPATRARDAREAFGEADGV